MDGGNGYMTGGRGNHNYEHLSLARSGNGSGGRTGQPVNNSDSETQSGHSHNGKMRAYSIDQYVQMSSPTTAAAAAARGHPQAAPRTFKPTAANIGQMHQYENMEPRSYNPNRKLRRSRDNYGEQFSIE